MGSLQKIVWGIGVASLVAGLGVRLQGQEGPVAWNSGDLFVAVGDGQYKVYDNTGSYKQTISDGVVSEGPGGFTTGCAFDNAGNLYTTNFSNTKVVKFDGSTGTHGVLQVIDAGATFPYSSSASSESITFSSNGDFFVGHADGDKDIQRYNAAGVIQQKFNVTTDDRGSDWIDLAADQSTIYYTSEGRRILRYNITTGQLTDFATLPSEGESEEEEYGPAFAMRLLRANSPGENPGLLVADSQDIKRLDGSGEVVQDYDVEGQDHWFALTLDPDDITFWAADSVTGMVYRFNITSGETVGDPIDTDLGEGSTTGLFGLCIKGGRGAAQNSQTIPLLFSPGTNVQQVASYNAATPNAHSWQATIPTVNTQFTLNVVATQVASDGVCTGAPTDPDPNDFDCRFWNYFSGDPGGIPKAVGYGPAGTAVFYRVENPPPDAATTGDIGIFIQYAQKIFGNLRMFRDPSSPPPPNAADSHDFVFDITKFVVGDPGVGGTTKKFNDYVVAIRSTGGGTATFLLPPSGWKILKGLPLLVTVRVRNASNQPIANAATPPNDMPLTITDASGNVFPVKSPLGIVNNFIYGPLTKTYSRFIATKDLPRGAYTLCVASVAAGDPTVAPGGNLFAPTCTAFTVK